MKKDDHYLFIDFEFTMPEDRNNPNGFFPEIIEYGIIEVKSGTIVNQYNSYVLPRVFQTLTNRCKNFLNITEGDLKTGVEFDVFHSLLRELDHPNSPTIATWGNMDMKVLKQNCQYSGHKFPLTGKQLDLSIEYQKFFGDRNQTGLWKAVQQYGDKAKGVWHRALDDARMTYELFTLIEQDRRYVDNYKPTTIGDVVDFSQLFNGLT